MKAATDPPMAVYDHNKVLVGVCDPDDLIDLPAGSVTYDATGAATGFVGTDGKLVRFADGAPAVKKAITTMVGEATAVAKQLRAHRVAKSQSRRPHSNNAFAYLIDLGTNCTRATVQKAKARGEAPVIDLPPLVAAACFYEESSAVVKAAIRARLGQCTPESQSAADLALGRVNKHLPFGPGAQPVAKGFAGQADAMRLANETAHWMEANVTVSKALHGDETPIQVLKRGWPKLNPDEKAHFKAQRAKCSEWSRLRLNKLLQRTV